MSALLELDQVEVSFPIRGGLLRRIVTHAQAVSGVSLSVSQGETVGIVGESGCGKTSLARAIVGLTPVNRGQIHFDGADITDASGSTRRAVSRQLQMIFQDPYTSLNPRATVRKIISAAWSIHPDVIPRDRWDEEIQTLLEMVGLSQRDADKYPHQFSGGQRQRIGIARALALKPKLIVCDEPVSALDVSIQAQVINLLQDLQNELGLTYVIIAHDLSVIRHISDRVAVMYLGKMAEVGTTDSVYAAAAHPYTQALLSSEHTPDPWSAEVQPTIPLTGEVPSPISPPSGCRFRTRCWKAEDICGSDPPALVNRPGVDHPVACHFATIELPTVERLGSPEPTHARQTHPTPVDSRKEG